MKGEVTWMWRLYHVLTTYLIICVSLPSKGRKVSGWIRLGDIQVDVAEFCLGLGQ